MISGALSNRDDAALVILGLRKDEIEKLLNGGKLFTNDLAGTMAMVRLKKHTGLIVTQAETEEELTDKIKADIETIQGRAIQMEVLHPQDVTAHPETQPEET